MLVRSRKDLYGGLLLLAFGIAAIVLARDYALGSAARMGPGYFPRMLGILLIVIGCVLILISLRNEGSPIPAWKWRPTMVVLGSVVLFGAIVQYLGLALSTVVLIVMSSAASTEFRAKEAVISAIGLAVLAVAVFILGLKLQLPIWPVFI
ncbi:MAG: tripartite tricarboxylate transporter TctB family protein [Betaproteobacteria bacterium]|nr:tripartite tricarboxylate transporter TctB family protein [Betaproteobacteria bacterium]